VPFYKRRGNLTSFRWLRFFQKNMNIRGKPSAKVALVLNGYSCFLKIGALFN